MNRNSCRKVGFQENWKGLFRHELFHVFGITHTQRRKDRNKFITVIDNNILPDERDQYMMCEACDVSHELPYECNSIMHYTTSTFSLGGRPTMISKNERKCKTEDLKWGTSVPTENDWKVLKHALKC